MNSLTVQLPSAFIERLKKIIPENQWNTVLESFGLRKPITFRLNTLKTSAEEIETEFPMARPVEGFANSYQVNAEDREQITHSKAMSEGKIYVQNRSSMLAPMVLDPQPGEEILDLTAAPGSKTTQIAVMMNNQGRIAAVEKVKSRYYKLKENCERQGITCVDFYCKDGALVWRSCENRFDRVLLDAPCSSEGRFNLHEPKSFSYWNEKKIKEMTRKQWPLLYSAFRSLKPGGVLVYSTCTFEIEENEQQISKLIKKFGDAVLIEKIDITLPNLQPGFTPIDAAVRILPNAFMDGFFICKIRKN